MKYINKISLRMRITLLTGTILIICSVILTIAASYNATFQFSALSALELSNEGAFVPVLDIESKTIGLTEANPNLFTAARKQFDVVNMVMLLVVCVLGMGMVYVVAGKSLRPIHELSKTASSITDKNLVDRIDNNGRTDEVGTLGNSFNIMLERLESSFFKQKMFSANVAHELKTPLATINAGIQVLNLDENPSVSDCKETLATTERNVKRLMAVVDDLMRLCDEQEAFDMETIVLQDFFETICDELKPLVGEKHIETTVSCNIPAINGNARLLYRAFFNIIENAIKYSKSSGKIIIEAISENGCEIIKITDTGDGIAEDERQYIFEPFYRVNKSRSRKTGGSGLGLSIVKMIIEKHGWEINVDSELNVGSVFTITLN